MSDPKAEREEEEQAEETDEGTTSGLLAQARAHRANRDMKACFEAYKKAAELGSAEGEHATALFYLNGSVVPQDLKEGATRLRAAAEKGSVPARVYLGNLYELGIHYKADPEKADVWYRNAARAARIDDEPGTDEYATALAELGCVRYVLAKVETGSVDDGEKARLLSKARANGYNLRIRDSASDADRLTLTTALDAAGVVAPASVPAPLPSEEELPPKQAVRSQQMTMPEVPASKKKKAVTPPPKKKAKPAGPARTNPFVAFGYALLFGAAGVGAAVAAQAGVRELVAHHGLKLPVPEWAVFPIVMVLVGVFPAGLAYRFGTGVKAQLVGLVVAGLGWVAWGTAHGALHASRIVQASALGLCGYLAALFVFGLLGGTKAKS